MLIGINDHIVDAVPVGPEILKHPEGDHPEEVKRNKVDQGKGYDNIMAEIL
jgi:hypothetical protein